MVVDRGQCDGAGLRDGDALVDAGQGEESSGKAVARCDDPNGMLGVLLGLLCAVGERAKDAAIHELHLRQVDDNGRPGSERPLEPLHQARLDRQVVLPHETQHPDTSYLLDNHLSNRQENHPREVEKMPAEAASGRLLL